MSTSEDRSGQRVRLTRKGDPKQTGFGTIISDPPTGETRFRMDDGTEVGAYQWYYAMLY